MELFSSNIKKLLKNEKKTFYISGSNFPSSKKKKNERKPRSEKLSYI